ncbi:MAG: hypothetical protein Q9160_006495 [Pyrenula sp. 1 TL-2023]
MNPKQAKKAQARKKNFSAGLSNRRRPSTISRSATDPGLALRWGTDRDKAPSQSSVRGLDGRVFHLPDSRDHSTTVSIKSDDDSDYESSPLRRHRKQRGSRTKLTLSLRPPESPSDGPWTDGEAAEIEPEDADQSKLKGIYWPGMSIFDSASDEMKKKRNQKKDGSLLKQMEKTSEIVEPQEIIYSPQGSLAKIRTITGMVEDSSPLKGESPIPKKRLPKAKRPPLAPISGNIVHRPRRETKPGLTNGKLHESRETVWQGFPLYEQRSSSNTSFHQSSAFVPTEDENREFKMTVGNLKPRSSGIQVFKDLRNSHSTHAKPFSGPVDGHQEYRMPALTYASGNANKPEFNAGHAPSWLRPAQSHPNLPSHLFSPERRLTSNTIASPLRDYGVFKQSTDPFMPRVQHPAIHNAYEWDGLPNLSEAQQFRGFATNSQGPTMAQHNAPIRHETAGFGINPLSFAFQRLQEPASAFAGGSILEDATSRGNGFISPNGTLSDPGIDLPYQF